MRHQRSHGTGIPWLGRLAATVRRHRVVLRSWALFLLTLGLFHALLDWVHPGIWDTFNLWTAHLTGWSLSLLGHESEVSGTLVSSSLYSVAIIRECTAVHPMVIFVAAVVAYPCSIRPKLLGIAAGLPTILLVNMVRLVSLCYVGRYWPDLFDTMHMLVWQSLIIFITVLLWILWAVTFVRRDEIRAS